ncbi:hypothetical protein IRT45_18470 [Nocardia sp. BSTN01]|uniref:hypothetical protein n=1 Tax=Nocardia sp. BSTN01 TaxID=2783665 RepID=UPI00188EF993|nr:hypothetical protein [Nocardia sp. BSTN01]MBF4999135.1 hypothetical protein [Nocardia sp. BSTN01]
MRENLRYTEALRHANPGTSEHGSRPDSTESASPAPTLLDVLHTEVARLTTTDATDTPTVLKITYESLDLTTAADRLLEETLLDTDPARFWPGPNGLGRLRDELEVALAWLETAPSLPELTVQDERVTMLAPLNMATQLYPGQLSDPLTHGEFVELVVIQARIAAVGCKAIWLHASDLLTRGAKCARDHDDVAACRVAALMARELADPHSINPQRSIDRRVLLAANDKHSRDELLADQKLMNLLYNAAAATARANGWSRMTDITAACMKADQTWACERWGYKADIALIAATKKFSIRRIQRQSQTVIEIRPRPGRRV